MHAPDGILGDDLPQEVTDFWIIPDGQFHKISRWPQNGSLRSDTKYRNLGSQFDNPIATRYLVNVKGFLVGDPVDDPTLDTWGWLDIPDGTVDDFEGETAASPFVPRCEFQILHVDVLPTLGVPGIHILATWFNAAGSFTTGYEYKDEGGVGFTPQVNTVSRPPDHRSSLDNGFGFISRSCEVFAMSECYEFPFHPDFDPGFADFNGIDGYISLSQNVTFANAPFRLSAEVRLRSTVNQWPILGKENSGGFFGMIDSRIIFCNLLLPTSWTPVKDVWVTWVYEFEPVTQLQHKLTIAGTVVRDSTNNRQQCNFNNLGVFRRTQPGVLWADMDMRHLKIETGTPGNYTTLLDMPLLVNALDSGPQANHGTTHNMLLPST